MKNWDFIYEKYLSRLKRKLPAHLTYHSWRHTEYVVQKTEEIAAFEGVSEKELFLLRIAALFHDYGFLIGPPENHEERSIEYCSPRLKKMGLSGDDIEKIAGMILATKIPQKPKNLLEEIIADADLEYLGTKKFKKIGELLQKEMQYFKPNLSQLEWDNIQINFMQLHEFHTSYCKQFNVEAKRLNLEHLINSQKP